MQLTGVLISTGQYMERCNVCNEKNYLSVCAHCEKKICVDCKAAHLDILKREIGRINNQVISFIVLLCVLGGNEPDFVYGEVGLFN